MKKIFCLLPALLLLLFSACSVQQEITPELFIRKLNKSLKEPLFDAENGFCYDNTFYCFSSGTGPEYVISMLSDESLRVYHIGLTSPHTEKKEDFLSLVRSIISEYAPDEDCEAVISALTCGENGIPSYHDSTHYSYSFISTDKGLSWSVSNNIIKEKEIPELTIKENDLKEYKNKNQ